MSPPRHQKSTFFVLVDENTYSKTTKATVRTHKISRRQSSVENMTNLTKKFTSGGPGKALREKCTINTGAVTTTGHKETLYYSEQYILDLKSFKVHLNQIKKRLNPLRFSVKAVVASSFPNTLVSDGLNPGPFDPGPEGSVGLNSSHLTGESVYY